MDSSITDDGTFERKDIISSEFEVSQALCLMKTTSHQQGEISYKRYNPRMCLRNDVALCSNRLQSELEIMNVRRMVKKR